MTAVTQLASLLATLEPVLSDTELVFCSIANAAMADCLSLAPLACFVEAEGLSLIIERPVAQQRGMAFETTFRAITLTVQSSLEAVGLTAAVTGRLALHGISANVVAAYHHDHIFVPSRDADHALQLLRDLQAEAASGV